MQNQGTYALMADHSSSATPSISSSASPTSFTQSPTLIDSTTDTLLPSTPFLVKLRPYRRYLIGASVVMAVILIVVVAVSWTRGGSHARGGVIPNNGGAGSGGSSSNSSNSSNSSCVSTKIETEGPYWVDEDLNRSDLSVTAIGLPIALELLVYNSSITNKCVPIKGAQVDIWHSDALGLYSDEQVLGTLGKTFLRGYQLANDAGVVNFLTIFPGWYRGRTVHIHVRVRVYDAAGKIIHNQTSQLFFDDTINDLVMANAAPYSARTGTRDTRNANDGLYHSELLVGLTGDVKSGYRGSFALGVPFIR